MSPISVARLGANHGHLALEIGRQLLAVINEPNDTAGEDMSMLRRSTGVWSIPMDLLASITAWALALSIRIASISSVSLELILYGS